VRPEDGFFMDSLAWVYYRKGDFTKAEVTQKKALALVPDDPVMLEHMGDIQSALGKDRDAAANYEKAIAKGHEKKDDVAAKLKKIRNARSPGK
jgi:Flp pilus assembly protein TadD